MARTERIETTKPVTPPRDYRADRGDTPTVALHDHGAGVPRAILDDDGAAPLPELNTRFGRYVILDRLGQGGMGVVYTAYDSELDRRVALKLLKISKDAAEGPTEGRARLVREAKAMAQLQHPNVVTVHDVGTIEGRVFVAMELVKGKTLRKWARAEPRTWREKVAILVQSGLGLVAAHAAGLVHRDFKPDNILVGDDGRVRVTDFGLARAAETVEIEGTPVSKRTGPVQDELTEPGLVMGTPPYMAPEQTAGRPADAKMDQFAFCVTLFELLHGERPFFGKTREEMRDQVHRAEIRPWPKSSDVPAWLRAVVHRGLAYDAAMRWDSMAELIDALRRRPWRRRFAATGALAMGVGAAIAVAAMPADDLGGRCEGADDQLVGKWDTDRKAAVRDAVVATGLSHAKETWDRVESRLDDYGDAWVAMRTQSCEATARGEQSEHLLDRRMACLDRRLQDLGAFVDVLAHADGVVVDRAVWAVSTLPRLEPCADLERLEAELGAPRDPAAAAAVANLRAELARAQALQRVARTDDALKIAAGAVITAESLDHAALRAEALHTVGSLHAQAGDAQSAEEALSDAALTAAANEIDGIAAAAATDMMHVVGTRPGAYKTGLLWGWYAESAVDRLGGGGVEEADMLHGLGDVFLAAGKLEEAKSHFEQAVTLRRDLLGADHPQVAHTLRSLGDLHVQAGDRAAATSTYRDALEISERAYGSLHPQVADLLERLGALERGTHHASVWRPR